MLTMSCKGLVTCGAVWRVNTGPFCILYLHYFTLDSMENLLLGSKEEALAHTGPPLVLLLGDRRTRVVTELVV